MSLLDNINNAATEEKLFQLVEEYVVDIETPLSWIEEADALEKQGDTEKAGILRAAWKRWRNLEKI